MQSFDFRIKVIREFLDMEVLNDDLRKEMNIEFIKKGLSTRVVDAVFGDETPLDSLDEIYHMAILRVPSGEAVQMPASAISKRGLGREALHGLHCLE